MKKESLLFCAGVLVVVMSTGLNPRDKPNNPDAARQEQYQRFALIAANRMSSTDYQECSYWQSDDNLIPETFVLAVIAVENYGRPPLRRWLEEMLARINLALLGTVPDYSLGIGQLKPSTARLVIQQTSSEEYKYTPDDSESLQLLVNSCENLKLAHEYLTFLAKKSGFTSFDKRTANVILAEYNGQQKLEHENIYQEVVWEVFLLYQKANNQEEQQEATA